MSLNARSNFMLVIAALFFIYAMLWVTAAFPSVNLPARFILDISDWPMDNLAAPLDRNTQWLSSISAGLLAGLAVIFGGIVAPAIKQRNVSITRVTIAAMVVWYVVDSVGSIAAGVVSNVFFNTIYLVATLIPLLGVANAKQG